MISLTHGLQHFFSRLFPPLVPIFAIEFGFPLWQLGLLLSIRKLSSGLGQTPMGILSDRYDRRNILPLGFGLLSIGYVVFGLLPSASTLLPAMRFGAVHIDGLLLLMLITAFVIGLGSSVVHPTSYPLITANVHADRKGKALGVFGSSAKFGDAIGPAVLGAFIIGFDWETILFGLGVLGILYAVLLFVNLQGYVTHPNATSGSSADKTDGTGDSDIGIESVWRSDRRIYIYPILAVFAYFAIRMLATSGVNSFIPQYVTSQYGYTFSVLGFTLSPASTASFYFSALMLTAGVTQLVTGDLVDRFDHRMIIIAFLLVGAAAVGILSAVALSPPALLLVLLLIGASLWGMNPARDSLISEITPPAREGRTFGYLWTGAMIAGSFSPVAIGYMGGTVGLNSAFMLVAFIIVLSAVPIALLFSNRFYVNFANYPHSTRSD